jgi:hypothetical protein
MDSEKKTKKVERVYTYGGMYHGSGPPHTQFPANIRGSRWMIVAIFGDRGSLCSQGCRIEELSLFEKTRMDKNAS